MSNSLHLRHQRTFYSAQAHRPVGQMTEGRLMMDNEWYEKKPIRKWHQMSDVERRQELEMISRSQLSSFNLRSRPSENV